MDENFEKITENGTWEEIAGESADDTETEEREFSEIEQKALSMGWKPKEEFEGNPDDWRDAKEYVDRDSLFRKIHNQGRELRKTQEALNALIEHNKKLSEAQREAERERLNAAKAEALEDGDYGKATNIDTEIDAMNQAEDDILNVPEFEPTPEESELFVQFKDRNQWYGTNEEITEVADMLANRFVAQKQAAGERYTEQDVYSFVESRVPNHFPDYFGKKTTRRSPTSLGNENRRNVESNARGKSKFTFNDLNAEQQEICRTFEKQGVLTRQEYVDQLAEMGELG